MRIAITTICNLGITNAIRSAKSIVRGNVGSRYSHTCLFVRDDQSARMHLTSWHRLAMRLADAWPLVAGVDTPVTSGARLAYAEQRQIQQPAKQIAKRCIAAG